MRLNKRASLIILIALLALFALVGLLFYSPSHFFSEEPLKEAYYYKKLKNKTVQCQLCPHRCIIPEGRRGFCGVRQNREGILYSLVYAKPCARHIDPIEKKPLFHFLPSSFAYSIATAGCNFRCLFCQNWQISQAKPEELDYLYLTPAQLVKKVKESGCLTIAYTYTEPVIFYEYMLDTAKLAKEAGIRNIMHSNGYINEEPLRELVKYLDAANIDLKGFSQEYYKNLTAGDLEPVLRTLKILKEEGVWLEITNLVLPGLNDSEETLVKMCLWIKENLGPDVPLHFSRFWPTYKMLSLFPTPLETLEKARKIALDCGLHYVYIGNIPGHASENTYCPKCGRIVIRRKGYSILEVNLNEERRCKFCGEEIHGVWK